MTRLVLHVIGAHTLGGARRKGLSVWGLHALAVSPGGSNMSPDSLKVCNITVHYTTSNWPEGRITGKVGTEDDNVIPPTCYASPGESLNCHLIRSGGWLAGHASEENMVAVSALPRWTDGSRTSRQR